MIGEVFTMFYAKDQRTQLGQLHPINKRHIYAPSRLRSWMKALLPFLKSPARTRGSNRQQVREFRTLMEEAIGPRRLTRICRKYRMDFNRMVRLGLPLTERHFAQLMAGLSDVLVEDVEELFNALKHINENASDEWRALATAVEGADNVTQLGIAQFQQLVAWLSPIGKAALKTTKEIDSEPTRRTALLFHDGLLMDVERLVLNQEAESLHSRHAYYELLCKGFAYREMVLGTLIPMAMSSGRGIAYYKVTTAIITGEGMVAYGLMPATDSMAQELDPILLFRGSSFRPSGLDALSTYITDLELELGRSAYHSGHDNLAALLEQLKGRSVLAMGHSLGGSLAQWFTAEYPEYVKELISFNAPGVPKVIAEQFAEKMQSADGTPKVTIYRTDGDLISSTGDKHLGQGCGATVAVTLIELDPGKGMRRGRHRKRHLHRAEHDVGMRHTSGVAVHKALDTGKRHPLEQLRRYGGAFFALYLFKGMRFLSRRILRRRYHHHR